MSAGDVIAVLHAPGTNRDAEAVRALALAGGRAEVVHTGEPLDGYAAVVVPGGFSYGDNLGAGARFALDCGAALAAFAGRGRPVLGICNGFQVLVRAGLLPGGDPAAGSAAPAPARVALAHNREARFVCRWVALAAEDGSRAGLAADLPPVIACPTAHGEGRLAVADPGDVDRLAAAGRVLFRYVEGTNPNGSAGDIAGLCNAEGNVWGLMPHPEDHVVAEQNPFPHRTGRLALPLFEAFVARARRH